MQELKMKMRSGEVSYIWLSDTGIGGIEIDKIYNIAKEEFVVTGEFDTIPENLIQLAKLNHVTINPSKRYRDLSSSPPQYLHRFGLLLLIGVGLIDLILLVLIYCKVSGILQILKKNEDIQCSSNP